MSVRTGLDVLLSSADWVKEIRGDVAYLCHAASVEKNLTIGIHGIRKVFGKRLKALFSPQHGFAGDVQANMVETGHSVHPYFGLPIYSLYSETRVPTDEMLKGLGAVIVDLQDVGTRVYTYIHTLTLLMERCGAKGVQVVVLDRPNPVNGVDVEGNVLEPLYASFVGRYPIPMRHALTMGEMALLAKQSFGVSCNLAVVPLEGWKRAMCFEETGLPWVSPSPNIPTVDSTYPYVGAVVLEGTNISEGRGTTRPFEILGSPGIEPNAFVENIERSLKSALFGCVLRPCSFIPTFDKHADALCGGLQIHVTDRKSFRPWRVVHLLLREFYRTLGSRFEWNSPPYEYEFTKLPFDILSGTEKVRSWIERGGTAEELDTIEELGRDTYLKQRSSILLYQ